MMLYLVFKMWATPKSCQKQLYYTTVKATVMETVKSSLDRMMKEISLSTLPSLDVHISDLQRRVC